jgi:hypothetical protein
VVGETNAGAAHDRGEAAGQAGGRVFDQRKVAGIAACSGELSCPGLVSAGIKGSHFGAFGKYTVGHAGN